MEDKETGGMDGDGDGASDKFPHYYLKNKFSYNRFLIGC